MFKELKSLLVKKKELKSLITSINLSLMIIG